MLGMVKLPFRRAAHWFRWRRESELFDAGALIALTPRPPDRHRAGERPDDFAARLTFLVEDQITRLRCPETPEWMLPVNVGEFLVRTRPGA